MHKCKFNNNNNEKYSQEKRIYARYARNNDDAAIKLRIEARRRRDIGEFRGAVRYRAFSVTQLRMQRAVSLREKGRGGAK